MGLMSVTGSFCECTQCLVGDSNRVNRPTIKDILSSIFLMCHFHTVEFTVQYFRALNFCQHDFEYMQKNK